MNEGERGFPAFCEIVSVRRSSFRGKESFSLCAFLILVYFRLVNVTLKKVIRAKLHVVIPFNDTWHLLVSLLSWVNKKSCHLMFLMDFSYCSHDGMWDGVTFLRESWEQNGLEELVAHASLIGRADFSSWCLFSPPFFTGLFCLSFRRV